MPVISSRSTTTDRSCASIASAESRRSARPGRWPSPTASSGGRAPHGHPVRRRARRPPVGGVGEVRAQQGVGRAAPVGGGRPPPRSAAPAPGCCAAPGRADRPARPSAAGRPCGGPGTATTPPPPAPRPRRPAARGSASRSSGRRRAAPAPAPPRRRPSPRPLPAAASAILRITTAACSRGRRSGAAGTTVAATSATAPPISASVQRVRRHPGRAAAMLTTIDCTAAWVTNSCPPSSRNAADIASATISVICHRPTPTPAHEQVGDEDPDRHADRDLDDPAQPLAVGRAEATTAAIGAKNGRRVAEHVGGDEPRDTGGDRALPDLPRLRPQPRHPGPHRGSAAAPHPVERSRLHGRDPANRRVALPSGSGRRQPCGGRGAVRTAGPAAAPA